MRTVASNDAVAAGFLSCESTQAFILIPTPGRYSGMYAAGDILIDCRYVYSDRSEWVCGGELVDLLKDAMPCSREAASSNFRCGSAVDAMLMTMSRPFSACALPTTRNCDDDRQMSLLEVGAMQDVRWLGRFCAECGMMIADVLQGCY
jgi:hypothetical protein